MTVSLQRGLSWRALSKATWMRKQMLLTDAARYRMCLCLLATIGHADKYSRNTCTVSPVNQMQSCSDFEWWLSVPWPCRHTLAVETARGPQVLALWHCLAFAVASLWHYSRPAHTVVSYRSKGWTGFYDSATITHTHLFNTWYSNTSFLSFTKTRILKL